VLEACGSSKDWWTEIPDVTTIKAKLKIQGSSFILWGFFYHFWEWVWNWPCQKEVFRKKEMNKIDMTRMSKLQLKVSNICWFSLIIWLNSKFVQRVKKLDYNLEDRIKFHVISYKKHAGERA
jgi:hypothetical protein